MNAKKWLKIYGVIVLIGIIAWMAINYFVDPLDYFKIMRGDEHYQQDVNMRLERAIYMKNHPSEYDGIIMGGSKSGVLTPVVLEDYTGKCYYNTWFTSGCFADYKAYTKYYIENTEIDTIILHLSSFEVNYYSISEEREQYKMPALVTGESVNREFTKNLFTNINSSITSIKDSIRGKVYIHDDGTRNYYTNHYDKFTENPNQFVNSYVLKDYENGIHRLFEKEPDTHAIADNIDALKEIKKMCKENNVELQVVIGPTFYGYLYMEEGEAYWDYLKDIAEITDYWDFSGFNDVNRNPYNFYDVSHYTKAVADKMIGIMYGDEEMDGFGVYVTKDNFDSYIEDRKKSYYETKEEYEKTGTVKLLDMNDESYIPD